MKHCCNTNSLILQRKENRTGLNKREIYKRGQTTDLAEERKSGNREKTQRQQNESFSDTLLQFRRLRLR